MKKKNLVILLMIPFIIAILGIVTINTTFNLIENDILGIDWDYNDMEAFRLSDSEYQLKANPIIQSKYPASSGNHLIWTVENKDTTEDSHAEVVEKGGKYYLKTLSVGEVVITCANAKGNVFRQMTGVIYDNGVILVNAKNESSQNNIDQTIYYGQYDLEDNQKKRATIAYDITIMPDNIADQVEIKDISSNVEMDFDTGVVTIYGSGKAEIVIGCDNELIAKSVKIAFDIVENGINVYSYDDLLYCTNKSATGEPVVLRKSFESLENTYVMDNGKVVVANGEPVRKSKSIELFGRYDVKTAKFSFLDDIYSFETMFNKEYIHQWNDFASRNYRYNPITTTVYAGLRVQQSIYGNGYTLNLHNLTYPYEEREVTDVNGNTQYVPVLNADNLFRGPLPFYTLGDPNNMPLITAYAQDNIGVYLDGDNIVMNDVNIKNCDYGNTLANLDTVGTVVEVNGDNITISNSRLANGKHVLRSYSSMNLTLNNCMFSDARNFLLEFGNNEYIKAEDDAVKTFKTATGDVTDTVKNYFDIANKTENYGDALINGYVGGTFTDKVLMKESLLSMQNALNDRSRVEGLYKGSAVINDCIFYRSGIASIVIETLFNGPYLYSKSPSIIGTMFGQMEVENVQMVPLEPENVSGTSYPVLVNISGDTRFYDYKKTDSLDLSGLIDENISDFANKIYDQDIRLITIDDIFPLKNLLYSKASAKGYLYNGTVNEETSRYINVPIAYYGGGLNLSTVTFDGYENISHLGTTLSVDLVDGYLELPPGSGLVETMKNLMVKTVTTVIGFEPFQFVTTNGDGYLFNETPSVSELKQNAKGA